MNRYLFLAGMLLQSFCFLSASGQGNFDKDYPVGMSTSTTIPPISIGGYAAFNSLVVGNQTNLQMVANYSVGGAGPFCYLEVISIPIENRVTYWTKPCPRTPQLVAPGGFWCQFQFASDGNLLLKSGANGTNVENGTVVWSSNTTGSAATSLELLESANETMGNLVLYNANREVVWNSIANNPGLEDYHCGYVNQAPPPTGRKLLRC